MGYQVRAYAHTSCSSENMWEPLEDHLREVAIGDVDHAGAMQFADAFGAASWGRVAGWWHDLGKYSEKFQRHLRGDHAHVDHSTVGAQHANKVLSPGVGRLIAYAIAGHHGGLLDAVDPDGGRSGLDARLKKHEPYFEDALQRAPKSILDQPYPEPPHLDLARTRSLQAFQIAFFGRMLFSCLVDADFLATERFMARDRARDRPDLTFDAPALTARLDQYIKDLPANASEIVNRCRADLLHACIEAADHEPGLYSLTAPTGSGKTLSSMAFALRHAARHDLRRVIYVLPFTSIIEQNAEVFRDALGDPHGRIVLEHHSSTDPDNEDSRYRLACENWDAPIVVTTSVQFLESLFASRTSRCRKLHRIARSVIVLDEAQTLPVEMLRPTLAAIDELCRNYSCTVVLCSATQPAVEQRDGFEIGFKNVCEIVPDPAAMARDLERVRFERAGSIDDDDLVERLAGMDRVLCVLNTRGHAARVFGMLHDRLSNGTCWHLSAAMCPVHRQEVVKAIRERLNHGEPCRVVSTSVIEAGVDVDFPVVYRAMTGLDSIVQAAGRCNRKGRLDIGRVVVFETDVKPRPYVKRGGESTREVAAAHDDPFSLDAIESYFALHYWRYKDRWDKNKVLDCFKDPAKLIFNYRQAAARYRIIEQSQESVIIPLGSVGGNIAEALQKTDRMPNRELLRRAQRYSVGVAKWIADQLIESGACIRLNDQLLVLCRESIYDKWTGLSHGTTLADPGDLIA